MKLELTKKYLVTTKEPFVAPDGESYRAAYGTVSAIHDAPDAPPSVVLGRIQIDLPEIVHAVQTETVNLTPPTREIIYNGAVVKTKAAITSIYFAN